MKIFMTKINTNTFKKYQTGKKPHTSYVI